MSGDIKALRCPSCGNPTNIVARELRYGYEFKCAHCSTTSVMIINRQLYTRKPGEHICIECGLIASRKARFCQCGVTLVRKCTSCKKETFIDNRVCDTCGWLRAADPTTDEGATFILEAFLKGEMALSSIVADAIVKLGPLAVPAMPKLCEIASNPTNHPNENINNAVACLGVIGPDAVPALFEVLQLWGYQSSDAVRIALRHLAAKGPVAVPALFENLRCVQSRGDCRFACHLLGEIGRAYPEWRQAITSGIQKFICDQAPLKKNDSSDDNPVQFAIEALNGFGAAALDPIMHVYRTGNIDEKWWANNALWLIGEPALPALRALTGFFANTALKRHAKGLIANIEASREKR